MDSPDTFLLLSEDLESDDMLIFCPTKTHETEISMEADQVYSSGENDSVPLRRQFEMCASMAIPCNGDVLERNAYAEPLLLVIKEEVKGEANPPASINCDPDESLFPIPHSPSKLFSPSILPPTPDCVPETQPASPPPSQSMPSPPSQPVPSPPSVPDPSSPSIPDVQPEETLVLDLTHEDKEIAKLQGLPLLHSRLRTLQRQRRAGHSKANSSLDSAKQSFVSLAASLSAEDLSLFVDFMRELLHGVIDTDGESHIKRRRKKKTHHSGHRKRHSGSIKSHEDGHFYENHSDSEHHEISMGLLHQEEGPDFSEQLEPDLKREPEGSDREGQKDTKKKIRTKEQKEREMGIDIEEQRSCDVIEVVKEDYETAKEEQYGGRDGNTTTERECDKKVKSERPERAKQNARKKTPERGQEGEEGERNKTRERDRESEWETHRDWEQAESKRECERDRESEQTRHTEQERDNDREGERNKRKESSMNPWGEEGEESNEMRKDQKDRIRIEEESHTQRAWHEKETHPKIHAERDEGTDQIPLEKKDQMDASVEMEENLSKRTMQSELLADRKEASQHQGTTEQKKQPTRSGKDDEGEEIIDIETGAPTRNSKPGVSEQPRFDGKSKNRKSFGPLLNNLATDLKGWEQPLGPRTRRKSAFVPATLDEDISDDDDFNPSTKRGRGSKSKKKRRKRGSTENSEKEALISSCSELCDIDLRCIINYDTWSSKLTAEERNRLLLLLPMVDRADDETLCRSFASNLILHATLREYQGFQKCATFETAAPRLSKRKSPLPLAEGDIDVEPFMSFYATPPELTEEHIKKLQFTYSNDDSIAAAAENKLEQGTSITARRKRKRKDRNGRSPTKRRKSTATAPRGDSDSSSPIAETKPKYNRKADMEADQDSEDGRTGEVSSPSPARSRYKTAKQKKLKLTIATKNSPKSKDKSQSPTKSKPKRSSTNGLTTSASPRETKKKKTQDALSKGSVSASFKAGAELILQRAGKPLTSTEIVRIGLEEGLFATTGKTPANTLASLLYTDMSKNKGSVFTKPSPGSFGLKSFT